MDMFVFIFLVVFVSVALNTVDYYFVADAVAGVVEDDQGLGGDDGDLSPDEVFPFPFPFRYEYEYDPTRLVLPPLPSISSLSSPSSSFDSNLTQHQTKEEILQTETETDPDDDNDDGEDPNPTTNDETPPTPPPHMAIQQSSTPASASATIMTNYLRNAHGLEVVTVTGNQKIDGIYLAFENSFASVGGRGDGDGDGGSRSYNSSSKAAHSRRRTQEQHQQQQQQQQQHCLIRWPLDGLGQGQFVDIKFSSGNNNSNSSSNSLLLCGGEPHGLTFSVEHTEQDAAGGGTGGGTGAIDIGGGRDRQLPSMQYPLHLSNLRRCRTTSRKEEDDLSYEKDPSSYYLYHVNNDQVVSKTEVLTGQIVWQNTVVPNITRTSQSSKSSGTAATATAAAASDKVDLNQQQQEIKNDAAVVPSQQSSSHLLSQYHHELQQYQHHQEVSMERTLSSPSNSQHQDEAISKEGEVLNKVPNSDYPYRPTWVAVPPDGPYVYLCDGYGSNFVYLMWRHNGTFVVDTNRSNTNSHHGQIIHWGGHVSNPGSIRTRDDLSRQTSPSSDPKHGLFATNHGCLYDPATQQIIVADRENGRLEYFDYFKYQNDDNTELNYHEKNSTTTTKTGTAMTKEKVYGQFDYSHTTDLRRQQQQQQQQQHRPTSTRGRITDRLSDAGRNNEGNIVTNAMGAELMPEESSAVASYQPPSLGNSSTPCILRRQVVESNFVHDDTFPQQPQVVYGVVPDLAGKVAVVARHIIPNGSRIRNTDSDRHANDDYEDRDRGDRQAEEDQVVYVIDVAKQLGSQGHLHPHDAQMLPNGDIIVATWNPGRLSYWKRVPN